MQFKLSLIALALTTLAVATPTRRNEPASQCTGSTGSLQCCQSVQQADSPAVSKILALLGVVIQDVTAQVGITCSPLVDVAGGTSCSSQAVCCADNSFKGVIAIGCNPVDLTL